MKYFFRLVCSFRTILVVVLVMAYLLSPYDLIPESVFGIVGLLDDVVFVLFALVVLAALFREFILRRH